MAADAANETISMIAKYAVAIVTDILFISVEKVTILDFIFIINMPPIHSEFSDRLPHTVGLLKD